MNQYYPEQRFVTDMMLIERNVRLPEEGIGQITIAEGNRVEVRDTVARVMMPSHYRIIPAAEILGLRDPATLSKFMLVKNRVRVSEKDVLAGKDAKRGKRVFAPMNGIVVFVGEGKIVMQATPEIRNIDAGLRGRVTRIEVPDSLYIEGVGGMVQGVWGNNRNVIAMMRMEPDKKIESLSLNALDTTYRNEVIVTTRPINEDMLQVAAVRRFAGLIAPSAPVNLLRHMEEEAEMTIILTEGFGKMRMNSNISNLLQEYDGAQVTLWAANSHIRSSQRPEIVINRAVSTPPPPANYNLMLREGMRVRITSGAYMGQYGNVVDLPDSLVQLPSGLRVSVATLELYNEEVIHVPLSNLEVAGR